MIPIEFAAFLLKEGVLEKYIVNLHPHECSYIEEGKKDWVSSAFVFCDTPEGHDFWFDINVKWGYINEAV